MCGSQLNLPDLPDQVNLPEVEQPERADLGVPDRELNIPDPCDASQSVDSALNRSPSCIACAHQPSWMHADPLIHL